MLKRQRGTLFQAIHHREGRAGETKGSRKSKRPTLASIPPSFRGSRGKQKGLEEAYAQGGRPASPGWGSVTLSAYLPPKLKDGCTARSHFHHRKAGEGHFMPSPPSKCK